MKYLLLLSVLISILVCAKSPDFVENDVVWLSANMGKTHSNNEDVKPNDSVNVQIQIGYDFNPYVGLYGGGGIASNIGSDTVSYVQSGIKLTYPFTSTFSIFSTLGAVSAINGGISHQLKSNIGLGVSYIITPQFSTQFGVDYKDNLPIYNQYDSDLNTVFWGLTYHFGRPDTSNKLIQQIEIIK
ncbi:outer membrane beta-barrel protein [Candidatus Enterovibrio escicola]|uniref:outer membrane beta-barrel protein n=1 Tax=Candidatus Enterovibrio escicola TaxID=1927127 RepID=UPI001237F964|nr:outer membrane beta-barrel protein [Candidatus Enterovibrio escacola]